MGLVLETATHKAQKPHWCQSCGGKIEAGQFYVRQRVVEGGDAWVWKAHTHCHQASEFMFARGIEGDDGALVNVVDLDAEDRKTLRHFRPDLAALIWPEVAGGQHAGR